MDAPRDRGSHAVSTNALGDSGRREEFLRAQRMRVATSSGIEEIPRADLEFRRFDVLHVPTGRLFHLVRGEVIDVKYAALAAFYVTPAQDAIFLEEPASWPKTLDEEAEQRAERERREAEQTARPGRAGRGAPA
jgi:hypothetical protein